MEQTLGTPIGIMVRNEDQRSDAYTEMETAYRPSHADYTYDAKFGVRAVAGGGRSSARETIGRVAAGAIARKVLMANLPGYDCVAHVKTVRDIVAEPSLGADHARRRGVQHRAHCRSGGGGEDDRADRGDAQRGQLRGRRHRMRGARRGAGLGEPVFDKLEADLAKAMLSLPATKGFEIGSGFAGTMLTGLEHNDEFFTDEDGRVRTRTNRSGGIQGGISNGEDIVFRVAFKPTATVLREQNTVTKTGEATTLKARGRHDPCVLPRAVPMVEAMVHLVLCDHLLRQRAQCGGKQVEGPSRTLPQKPKGS